MEYSASYLWSGANVMSCSGCHKSKKAISCRACGNKHDDPRYWWYHCYECMTAHLQQTGCLRAYRRNGWRIPIDSLQPKRDRVYTGSFEIRISGYDRTHRLDIVVGVTTSVELMLEHCGCQTCGYLLARAKDAIRDGWRIEEGRRGSKFLVMPTLDSMDQTLHCLRELFETSVELLER
jgi:hypothetical protein